MFDREKGIYPAGQYLVGRDIPLGGYILSSKGEKLAFVSLYQTYEKFKKDEDSYLWYESFTDDYHISLMEENTFLHVENADIQRL